MGISQKDADELKAKPVPFKIGPLSVDLTPLHITINLKAFVEIDGVKHLRDFEIGTMTMEQYEALIDQSNQ